MDFITLLDGIVITIVLLSALLAMYRGFLREVLSIAAWVAAGAAAGLFHKPLVPLIKPYVGQLPDTVVTGIAAVSVFVVTLLVVSYITMKISDFVVDSAFGPLDRSFGFLFGAARGLLLIVVAMLFYNWFVPVNQPAWVSGAKSKPLLDFIGARLVAALPEDPESKIMDAFKRPQQPPADDPADDTPDTPPPAAKPPAGQPQQRSNLQTPQNGADVFAKSLETVGKSLPSR